MKFIILVLLSVLIFFPETSLDTSRAIEKNSLYSIYLYRIFGLALSDWTIIVLSLIILVYTLITNKIYLGIIKPILIVYLFYLMLGLVFNLSVNYDLKAFLYDVKVSLYMFIPYLSLSIINYQVKPYNKDIINRVLILLILGSILDAFYIYYMGGAEYTSILGMPLILQIAPIPLLLGAFYYLKPRKASFGLLSFEFLSSFNRVNLGSLFWGMTSSIWIFLLGLRVKFKSKVMIITVSYYSIVVVLPLLIVFVFSDLVGFKKGGMEIRRIEVANFIENSNNNIPIVIGKGLGSTWKEIIQPEFKDFYSQGSHLNSEYKFIWHNTLAGSFYKFGIFGSLFLIVYLSTISVKLYRISRITKNNVGMFVAFSIPAFVMINVNGPGVLKGALISSLLLYAADQMLNRCHSTARSIDK
jgi:hypothetical protein